jgi:TPR repeat protein
MSQDPIMSDVQNASGADPNLQAAVALFRSGDEAGAFPGFKKLADTGSAPAMTWLGYVFLRGKGVTADATSAREWFSKAVDAGDAEAMTWLGEMNFYGDGVPVDMAAARRWYLKAAEAGEADAMSKIGRRYFDGDGGPVDKAAAREWYLKAAEAGDAYGQHCLAAMLDQGGERATAELWMKKAADQGFAPAVRWIDEQRAYEMYNQKRYAEALPLFNRLASDGSAWAQECLGYMYWDGIGVARDFDQSLRHYEAAYDGGKPDLAYNIAGLHLRAGRPDVALVWWRKDTKRPISSTYWQYRVLREHPHLAANPGESGELLRRAADLGHLIAKRDIAVRMIKGDAALGGRWQGVRAWLRLFPAAVRIVSANVDDDERLR